MYDIYYTNKFLSNLETIKKRNYKVLDNLNKKVLFLQNKLKCKTLWQEW